MKKLYSLILPLVFLIPVSALAASATPSTPSPLIPPVDSSTLTQIGSTSNSPGVLDDYLRFYWTHILAVLFLILGILAVIYLIYASIQYITSNGSPERSKAARQSILNTLLGIIILVASYFIIDVIINLATSVAQNAG